MDGGLKDKNTEGNVGETLAEKCRSPLNPKCGRTDVVAYIMFRGAKLPVCSKCWAEIAESDIEWGEEGSSKRERRRAHEPIMAKIRKEALEELATRALRKLKSSRDL